MIERRSLLFVLVLSASCALLFPTSCGVPRELSQETCIYTLTGKEGPMIRNKGQDVDIVFRGRNAANYVISRGGFAGWNIAFEWKDPFPTSVKCDEVFSIGISSAIQSAGPGAIGAGVHSWASGGAVWNLVQKDEVKAGRSGSTGQLYQSGGSHKYKPTVDTKPAFVIEVVLQDGGSTDVLLARYVYTRQAGGEDTGPVGIFQNPTHQGYRIDRCLTWGQDCDKPAADRFCRDKGFTGASSWQWEHVKPTLVLGDGKVCDADFCGAFSRIECIRITR